MNRASISSFMASGHHGFCVHRQSSWNYSPSTAHVQIQQILSTSLCVKLKSNGRDSSIRNNGFYHRSVSSETNTNKNKSVMATKYLSFLFIANLIFGKIDVSCIPNTNSNQAKASIIDSSLSDWPPSSDGELFGHPTQSEFLLPSPIIKRQYWDIMSDADVDEITLANEKLVDHAVATVNTMYYDSSGGFEFDPHAFYDKWKNFRHLARHGKSGTVRDMKEIDFDYKDAFSTRNNAVKTLKWLVSTIHDPYSKYLTREELRDELEGGDDGFLGLGAFVDSAPFTKRGQSLDVPTDQNYIVSVNEYLNHNHDGQRHSSLPNDLMGPPAKTRPSFASTLKSKRNDIISVSKVMNLPIVTAVVPDSPAERAGIVVGDRIAAVGTFRFTGMSRSEVERTLRQKFHAGNYFGQADVTIAKPIVVQPFDLEYKKEKYIFENGWYRLRPTKFQYSRPEQIVAYKLSHATSIPTAQTARSVRLEGFVSLAVKSNVNTQYASIPDSTLATSQVERVLNSIQTSSNREFVFPALNGGDSIVHYTILTASDSIFQTDGNSPVGYIRLTRFSKASTAGYINAITTLDAAGVKSYIIDLRNNYGGVIQEAMLTASTLLRDPQAVLCYTLNSRGGFRPQENMEYIIDKNYPGYFLSSEPRSVALDEVKREHPEYLEDGWSSPTSYASLHELKLTRGIKSARSVSFAFRSAEVGEDTDFNTQRGQFNGKKMTDVEKLASMVNQSFQKKLVILINEGTASAAEVFASSLHDNGRTVALIGSKTFGKGLIQHTFPMPDGGGLRLTVAEYLTPSLSHVTKVGGARFDSGIQPDIWCESKQGIPKNIGADLCVGVALDVLGSYH